MKEVAAVKHGKLAQAAALDPGRMNGRMIVDEYVDLLSNVDSSSNLPEMVDYDRYSLIEETR